MEIYCLSCKKNTKSKNVRGKITKNNKPYLIVIERLGSLLGVAFCLISERILNSNFRLN